VVQYRVVALALVFGCGCGRIAFDADSSGITPHLEVTAPVTLNDPGTTAGCPTIVWNGNGWGVAWADVGDTDTYFARFDATGVKQGGTVRVTNTARNGYCPSLAWSGSEYVIAMRTPVCTSAWVEIYKLDANGAQPRDFGSASSMATDMDYPSIAWNGSGYHLTWIGRNSFDNARFMQLDPTAKQIGTDFPLSTASAYYPTVIGTPPGSAAAWTEGNLVRFAALNAGAVAYQMPITATGSISEPVAAAWTGSALALAWLSDPFHLWFALADLATGDTTVPDETAETVGQVRPLVASYPSGFGLVQTYPMSIPSLVFALRDASGAKVGEGIPLAAAGSRPSLAFGKDRFAVVYADAGQIQLVFVKP